MKAQQIKYDWLVKASICKIRGIYWVCHYQNLLRSIEYYPIIGHKISNAAKRNGRYDNKESSTVGFVVNSRRNKNGRVKTGLCFHR